MQLPLPENLPPAFRGRMAAFARMYPLLRKWLRPGSDFPDSVGRWLSSRRQLGSTDRRWQRAWVYAAVRHLPWIEAFHDSPDAFWTTLAAVSDDEPRLQDWRLALGWPAESSQGNIFVRARLLNERFPERKFAVADLLPNWVFAEYPELGNTDEVGILFSRPPLWIRIAPGRNPETAEAIGPIAGELVPSREIPGAWRTAISSVELTRLSAWQNGAFEIQDAGSQWILATAGIRPGEHWLDACAGSGGKSLQLLDLVGPKGSVTAWDPRKTARDALQTRIARRPADALAIGSPGDELFDGVLVDAPCSGSGTWRRRPHLKWQTTDAALNRFAIQQREILAACADRVAPGGRLIYATCSIARTENETVVRQFLEKRSDYRTVDPPPDATGIPRNPGELLPAGILDSDAYYRAILERVQ